MHAQNSELWYLHQIVQLFQEANTYSLEALGILRDIQIEQKDQGKTLEAILEAIRGPEITDFQLFQGDNAMAITGVQVGGTGTFQIGFVPPNGVPLQSGPTVSVDDTLVTLGAVDGNNQFTAAVAASDTGASFNVTVAGVNGAGTALSHVFNVPIIQAPPPQISDFSLDQVS